jgi:hypothetical protein
MRGWRSGVRTKKSTPKGSFRGFRRNTRKNGGRKRETESTDPARGATERREKKESSSGKVSPRRRGKETQRSPRRRKEGSGKGFRRG